MILPMRTCPFCGSQPKVWRTTHGTYVMCEKFNGKDHLIQVMAKTDEEACQLWNGKERLDGVKGVIDK